MSKTKMKEVSELSVDEWLEVLENLCKEEGYVLIKCDEELRVALLKLDDTYWRLNENGKLEAVDKEKAEKIAESAKRETITLDNLPARTTETDTGETLPATSESMFHVEEFTGIPKEFMIKMGERGNEQIYVKRAGLLYKAEKKGVRAIQVELEEIENGYMAKATLYPKITPEEVEVIRAAQGLDPEVQREVLKNVLVPYTEYATATTENVKMRSMYPYLRELACTRASNRALRAFVACGFTSVEEMPDYIEEE